MNEQPTVSITQAMALVGASRRTIYNWMDSGKVDYIRTAGGSRRIIARTLWRDGSVPAATMTQA